MLSNSPSHTYWMNALKLMRIPFSIFLMPIYWYALSDSAIAPLSDYSKALFIFIILHLLVYPASNGYNSYCDKDEDSVGGLEKPPQVTKHLYYMVIWFDLLAITVSLAINAYFAIAMFVYIMVSKAYSYQKIRLKKYPILSALIVTVFQGMFIYLAVVVGMCGQMVCVSSFTLGYSLVATLFLLGSYPLTQIYQHKSDALRGDKTLSMWLGIKNTFIFSAIFFIIATLCYSYLKYEQGKQLHVYAYMVISCPILIYFMWWSISAIKDPSKVSFKHTMNMNKISSLSMSLIFIVNLFL